jgi:phosphohistidine phosphatase
MKTLLLLRHAKAVSGSDSLRDLDRSLNDQGRRQAESVGKYLKEQNIDLDLVLSSTARRARETTELVLAAAECVTEVRYDPRIYEASRQQLLEVVSEIEEDKSQVLLVGHNPGLEELLQRLTGCFESMGTGTLAKVDLKSSHWNEAADHEGHLDWLLKPQELARG